MMDSDFQQLSEQLGVTQNQFNFARSLGLDLADAENLEQLMAMIEARLGQDTMLQQARWFLLSVLRHANRAKWNELSESGITEEKQIELTKHYISSDDLKQSLRTVLKEIRCRFTLIRFAKARNIEKFTLSTTTKAYKQALVQLDQAGLISEAAKRTRRRRVRKQGDVSDSVVNRRAARRGYFDEEVELIDEVEIHSPESKRENEAQMSEEEYAELAQVIEGDGERAPTQNWSYPTNEDRLSLLMGLAAGGGVFVIVLLLFL